MRTAFFGTPHAAVPALAVLNSISEVQLVVTRPDKPRGRSGHPLPSAVKEAADELDLPVAQPEQVGEVASRLEGVDIAVLVAYGQIIPPQLLEAPTRGFVNVHFSLLPRWRGAAPVQRAILAGDEETGVTLMVMDHGLDTGPVLEHVTTPIGETETAGDLTGRLARLGADLLGSRLPDYVAGDLEPSQQQGQATQAPKVTSDEARLDLAQEADEVTRKVRAFNPRPGAWVELKGERFKLLEVSVSPEHSLPAGRVEVVDGLPLLGTGSDALEVTTVQPAGRQAMDAVAWMNGRRNEPAELL